MSAALDRVLARLRELDRDPRKRGAQWQARCPAHDDDRPSLSVGEGERGVVLCCHAGCEPRAIVESLGLKLRDLFHDNSQGRGNGEARRIVATYPYVDEQRRPLFEKVRYAPKGFAQRRPDGAGDYVWNLKGVRRVLYRLPELVAADADAMIYVVEGERDADRLRTVGLHATTNPDGAGKWARVDDAPLEGRHVAIVGDADDAGRCHAEDVACRLSGRAASVRVLELPDLPEKGDVSDWLDAGNDVEDLDRLAAAAPEWEPKPEPIAPPYRSAAESMAALNAMAKTSREKRATGARLCDQVAEWFDRNGPETLEKAYSISYVARAVGVSRCHFHRLGQLGRVRRLLRARNTSEDIDQMSDRALSPLMSLLDRPKALQDAFAAAREAERAAEQERQRIRQGGDRPPPRKQLATFMRNAVRPFLPESAKPTPARDEPPPMTPTEVCRQVARCLDAVNMMAGAPDEARHGLEAAHDALHEWTYSRPVVRERELQLVEV